MMEAGFKTDALPAIPGTQAVQRVLSILRAFSEESPKRSLTELSLAAGLNKATAHRMLSVLERDGFVYRSPETGEFQLGSEMIVLGARALKSVDVRAVARSELQGLARETGEDATLEILVKDEVLIVDEERGRGLLVLGTELGTRWPAHATATGKVLLAFAGVALAETGESLPAVTEHTIVSWDRWKATLSEVLVKGYATNIEELVYGYISVAAPIRDREGCTTAALSIGGSVERVTVDRIPALAKIVQEAAARISERLGYRKAGEK
jgi:DNA-binding IclR family transcriptional regulator